MTNEQLIAEIKKWFFMAHEQTASKDQIEYFWETYCETNGINTKP